MPATSSPYHKPQFKEILGVGEEDVTPLVMSYLQGQETAPVLHKDSFPHPLTGAGTGIFHNFGVCSSKAVVFSLQHFLSDKTQTQGKKDYKKVNSSQMPFMFT